MDGTEQPVVPAAAASSSSTESPPPPPSPPPSPPSAGSTRARKACVRLTGEQRAHLQAIADDGGTRRKRFVHARALLMADQDHPQGRYTDRQIGAALGVAAKTVARCRAAFLRSGVTVAVERKPRATPPVAPVIDGKAEATLVAIDR